MSNVAQSFRRIQDLQWRYHEAKTGKESLLKLLYESEVAEQVYNSNAIENSTLSLDETDKILRQINLDRFISERELFEAKNLARVVEYIDKKAKGEELSLDIILLLHKMLISNIRDDIAGRFRNLTEWVRVGSQRNKPLDSSQSARARADHPINPTPGGAATRGASPRRRPRSSNARRACRRGA